MNHILWWERNLAFSPKGIKGTSWSIIKLRERKGRQWLPTGLKKSRSSNWVNLSSTTNAAAPEPACKTGVVISLCSDFHGLESLKALICVLFYHFLGFPGVSDGKEFACNAGDSSSIPGSGRSPGGGNGNPLQYSCLGNPMDRGAWRAAVHGVAKSQTRLSDQHFRFIILIAIKFIFDSNSKERIKHAF